jgi:hypothetical protein
MPTASRCIFPQGTGAPNAKGLDFYNRLVDALVAAGIAPFPTLYHWDLPQALQDKGGWQSRDTVNAFGDYAGYIADKLSDRVRHFFTINEFRSFVDCGHHGHELKVPGGTRLFPVEHDGQFRMECRLRQSLRAGVRGLRDAEAHAQAERRVVSRGCHEERGGVRGGNISIRIKFRQ